MASSILDLMPRRRNIIWMLRVSNPGLLCSKQLLNTLCHSLSCNSFTSFRPELPGSHICLIFRTWHDAQKQSQLVVLKPFRVTLIQRDRSPAWFPPTKPVCFSVCQQMGSCHFFYNFFSISATSSSASYFYGQICHCWTNVWSERHSTPVWLNWS